MALGVVEDAVYAETRVTSARGEVLLLFTDGVTEAVNSSGELFSDSRLLREFATCAGAPTRTIVDNIVEAVNAFAGSAPQEDDITVLAVRYLGPS